MAKKWLNEQQRNVDLGIYLPNALASKKTFAEAVARYYKEELPKKGNDARNRKQHLDWWNQHLGASSLALIRPSLIKATISILETEESAKKTKRAPGTVIRYIASLSHLLSVAWKEWEWIPENPVFKITKPSLSNARQRYLSREEQTALLEEVKKSKCPVLLLIVVLALSTGMRAGKIINLKWGDVNFAEGVIRLRTTKNGEPLTIPLMGYAHSLLSDHQRRSRHLIKEALSNVEISQSEYESILSLDALNLFQISRVARGENLSDNVLHGIGAIFDTSKAYTFLKSAVSADKIKSAKESKGTVVASPIECLVYLKNKGFKLPHLLDQLISNTKE